MVLLCFVCICKPQGYLQKCARNEQSVRTRGSFCVRAPCVGLLNAASSDVNTVSHKPSERTYIWPSLHRVLGSVVPDPRWGGWSVALWMSLQKRSRSPKMRQKQRGQYENSGHVCVVSCWRHHQHITRSHSSLALTASEQQTTDLKSRISESNDSICSLPHRFHLVSLKLLLLKSNKIRGSGAIARMIWAPIWSNALVLCPISQT